MPNPTPTPDPTPDPTPTPTPDPKPDPAPDARARRLARRRALRKAKRDAQGLAGVVRFEAGDDLEADLCPGCDGPTDGGHCAGCGGVRGGTPRTQGLAGAHGSRCRCALCKAMLDNR